MMLDLHQRKPLKLKRPFTNTQPNRLTDKFRWWIQPIDAIYALNLSAGV